MYDSLEVLIGTNYFTLKISWNFYSKNGDIGFAVYSKQLNASTDRNPDLVPAVLYSRVDCHLTPENGEISCSEPDICNLLHKEISSSIFYFDDFLHFFFHIRCNRI